MWVITRAHNDYNQYGEYLETVFEDKPNFQQLSLYFFDKPIEDIADEDGKLSFLSHVFNGGGRRGKEDEWFHLKKLKEGEEYHSESGERF